MYNDRLNNKRKRYAQVTEHIHILIWQLVSCCTSYFSFHTLNSVSQNEQWIQMLFVSFLARKFGKKAKGTQYHVFSVVMFNSNLSPEPAYSMQKSLASAKTRNHCIYLCLSGAFNECNAYWQQKAWGR